MVFQRGISASTGCVSRPGGVSSRDIGDELEQLFAFGVACQVAGVEEDISGFTKCRSPRGNILRIRSYVPAPDCVRAKDKMPLPAVPDDVDRSKIGVV